MEEWAEQIIIPIPMAHENKTTTRRELEAYQEGGIFPAVRGYPSRVMCL